MALGEMLGLLWLFRNRGAAPAPTRAAPSHAPPDTAGPMPAGAGPDAAAPSQTPAATPDTSQAPATSPAAASAATPAQAPAAVAPVPNLPWPQGPIPSTLPPFPGPGWEPSDPPSAEIQTRALYWNPILWDFSTKTQRKPYVQENFGGSWITWAAAWHPGDKGPKTFMATEAWRVKAPTVSPAPVATSPVPVTVQPSQAAAAPTLMATPGVAPTVVRPSTQYAVTHVSPYPGPGAWKSNAAYVKRYQVALDALGYVGKDGQPLVVDGKAGPNVDFAVRAFQGAHGLAVDGQAGGATAAALDVALDALASSHVPGATAPSA